MNEPHEPTIREFNPGTFQSDEEVIRQFVVRKRELGIVLDTLRGNVGAPSCQHVLLVGPRGRGKTMLLARAAAEIRTDEELSGQLLPVRFMEESHEIFDLGDFWLEALFYLAQEITDSHPRISRDLRTTHAAFARQGYGVEFEERARATVLETADRLGRRLVLMVENLQALCSDVDDDFGWKLRESLQTEPKVMLLATATGRFEGLDDAREPFFELFRLVCLERLDTEECQRLWQMASGEERSERQIKALEILTGGDPRLLVILARFSRHRSLRDLMEEMVSLIDKHTEYFRSHLEGFAKTERRVYLGVIDLWQPSYASEVAERARMDIRTVSALLGRLANRGVVWVEGVGRKRQYSATQRLYSIYYKLRRERDEAAVVRNLIHFMTAFYTDEELTEMSGKLRLEALQYPFIREGIERAMSELPARQRELFDTTNADIKGFEDHDVPESQVKIAAALLNKGIAQLEGGDTEAAVTTCNDVIQRFENDDAPELRTVVANAFISKGIAQSEGGDTEAAIATCNDVIQRFENDDISELQKITARALLIKGEAETTLRRTKDALHTCDELERKFASLTDRDAAPFAWYAKWIRTKALVVREDHPAAMDAFHSVYDAFIPENDMILGMMIQLVIDLTIGGASERDLVEILASDQEKSAKLEPLVVALRKRMGEKVRAPVEVMEVAASILQFIDTEIADASSVTTD